MYKSFILPILDYADVLWDNITEGQATLLENLNQQDHTLKSNIILLCGLHVYFFLISDQTCV